MTETDPDLTTQVHDLAVQQARIVEAINAFSDHMEWFREETDKLVKAAGPLLSMAGPMIGQFMSGQVPTPPTELANPDRVKADFDG